MADERVESIGVAVDPVDHVAAVGSARRRNPGRIHEPQSRGVLHSGHDVDVDPATPVLRDLVHEPLAEPRGAPRVEQHGDVARCGEHLRIPARVEVVAPCALRAAVDQHHERVPLSPLVLWRPHQHAPHRVAVRPHPADLLRGVHLHLLQQLIVERGEAPRLAPGVDRPGEDLAGPVDRIVYERQCVAVARNRQL